MLLSSRLLLHDRTMHMQSLPRLKCISLLQLNPDSAIYATQIHAQIITNGVHSPPLFAKLIELYCSKQSPNNTRHAHFVFRHFHPPNLRLFNTLLRCILPKESIAAFAGQVSNESFLFDDHTYVFVLGACARSCSVSTSWEGKQVHSRIVKHGFVANLLVQTTLLHFYGSSKDVASARKVFDEMPVRSSPTWNAMLKGYYSSSQKEHSVEAVILFRHMLVDDTKPTGTTMVCVLSAASRIGQLETGTCIHGFIEKTIRNPTQDVFIGTDLINMYSKCGSLESALAVFNEMESRNILTWTAMASGLAIHGRGKEALELLALMESHGFRPNEVTFTSLLSACCHGGLIEEGLHLFHHMEGKFGIPHKMQHYGCIVDLLGKAGKLEEALGFIQDMETEPDAILWRCLLSCCNLHGDALMAEKVGKLLLEMETEKKGSGDSDYVALSNVYASMEKWKEVEMVRKEMKAGGVKAKHGSSLVHVQA